MKIKNELEPGGISAAVDTDDQEQTELNSLGQILQSKYTEYKDARDDIEDDWIEDLRAFMGQYDPDVLAKDPIQGRQIPSLCWLNKNQGTCSLLKND